MAKIGVLCSAALAVLLFLGACEKPLQRTTPPPPSMQTAPVTLSVMDTPPAGVLVLSFQLTFTGATLQPGSAPVLSSPVAVQAASLETGAVPLATMNVPAGTYSSIGFNVASPVLTILNQSGAAVAGCANNTICKFTGSATPVPISFTGLPFPVTVTANTPVGLLADLNLNNIIQPDLSLRLDSTSLSLSVLPPVSFTGTLQTVEGFLGQVTALGTNQFTVMNAPSGLSLTISVTPGTTVFQNFDTLGCTASPQNFSCLQVGQVVAVDLNVLGNGTPSATTVDAEDAPPAGQEDLEGVLVATGPVANQFQMVVLDEEPIPPVPSVSVGDSVLVNIVLPAAFGVDADGLAVPGTFTFASTSDLSVGQEILVQVTSVFPNPNPPGGQEVDTSRLRLRMSQFSAVVNTKVDASTFTVTALAQSGLPALVATGPVTVSTSSQTEFSPSNLTVSALNVGDTVSLRGLLFNSTSPPTLVTRNVRKR